MADDGLDGAIAPISLPAMFVYRLRLYGVECDNEVSMGHMMTSSNGNVFRFTGPLLGEFTGHLTKSSNAELLCFL